MKITENGSRDTPCKYFFTNATGSKVRPVLVLKSNSFNDLVYLPLTTNTITQGIRIDNQNMADGYLPKISIVAYEKPGVLSRGLLIKKIGTLDTKTYRHIVDQLIQFLQKN